MNDLINRQSTLKDIEKIRQSVQMLDDTQRASIIMNGIHLCEKAVRNQPSTQPKDWMEQNRDRILQAGNEGREVEFRIGGRLFAIREKAQ